MRLKTVQCVTNIWRSGRGAWQCSALLLAAIGASALVAPSPLKAAELGSPIASQSVSVDHGLLRVQVTGTPLSEVLRSIAEAAGFQLKLKGDLAGPVNWNFAGVELEEGIRRLVGRYGLVVNYVQDRPGTGEARLSEVIVIGPANGKVAIFVPTPQMLTLDRAYEGLDKRDRVQRLNRVNELAGVSEDESLRDLITILSQETDTVIRRAAVIALGKIGTEEAVEVLAAALDDEDALVRRQVTRVLGAQGTGVTIALLKALKDSETSVRVQAARALAKFPSDDVAYALRDALTDDADAEVRLRAVLSLAEHDTPLARSALETAVADSEASVGAAAKHALGREL